MSRPGVARRVRDLARGSLLMVASGLAFGSLTTLAKLAYAEGISVSTLLLVRFLVAALALAPFAIAWACDARAGWRAFALGAVGYAATTLLYFHALETLPAGVASFLLYLAPLPVVVFARVLFREQLTRSALTGLAIGLAGVAALTLGPVIALSTRGVLLALGSALAYAGTILAGRRVIEGASPWTVATGICAGAATAWAAWGFATSDLAAPPSAAGWGYALVIALLCTAVAIVTFYYGIRLVGAARASILSMVEPASSVAIAGVLLGEALTSVQLAGCGLILVGVLLATR